MAPHTQYGVVSPEPPPVGVAVAVGEDVEVGDCVWLSVGDGLREEVVVGNGEDVGLNVGEAVGVGIGVGGFGVEVGEDDVFCCGLNGQTGTDTGAKSG